MIHCRAKKKGVNCVAFGLLCASLRTSPIYSKRGPNVWQICMKIVFYQFRNDLYCFENMFKTLKEHFHDLLLSTNDDKDNRETRYRMSASKEALNSIKLCQFRMGI